MVNRPKPKLSYSQQIDHLKQKGVQFTEMSEDEALHYLQYNNDFFKLKSYRKNFNKDISRDKYVHLDSAYLIDLAIIDTRLRMIIAELSLDIEHFSKVNLLQKVTSNQDEDGYSIVDDYINSLPADNLNTLRDELRRSLNSPYCHDLYNAYRNHMPVWVFVELISFGSYIYFYLFCANRFQNRSMRDTAYLLKKVKTIRNAAAHNNCIINDLKRKDNSHRPSRLVQNALSDLGISRTTQRNKLRNEAIEQIVTCIYTHKILVSSPGVQKHMSYILDEFKNRLYREYDYTDNTVIKSVFDFLIVIIENWFPLKKKN